jgi:regulator of cell morphogenesis and NO signaling
VLSHLEKEEQILFPMIVRGDGTYASGPICVMEEEHVEHAIISRAFVRSPAI